MAAKRLEEVKEFQIQRPKRAKLSAQEALERMQAFEQERKEKLIATVRKGKG